MKSPKVQTLGAYTEYVYTTMRLLCKHMRAVHNHAFTVDRSRSYWDQYDSLRDDVYHAGRSHDSTHRFIVCIITRLTAASQRHTIYGVAERRKQGRTVGPAAAGPK